MLSPSGNNRSVSALEVRTAVQFGEPLTPYKWAYCYCTWLYSLSPIALRVFVITILVLPVTNQNESYCTTASMLA